MTEEKNSIEELQRKESKVTCLLALFSYPVSYFYLAHVFGMLEKGSQLYYNWNLMIFTLFYLAGVEWIARSKEIEASKESIIWMIYLLLLSGSLCLFQPLTLIRPLQLFMIHAVAIYWTLCRSGSLINGKTSSLFFVDCFFGFCLIPFRNFFFRSQSLFHQIHSKLNQKEKKNPFIVGITFILILVLGSITISLLSSADASFEAFGVSFTEGLIRLISFEFLIVFLLSIPVGQYCTGLILGVNPRQTLLVKEKLELGKEKGRFLPTLSVHCVFLFLSAVYTLFFIVQGQAYLSLLMQGRITAHLACEYAVRGFWQLCLLVLLNLFTVTLLNQIGLTSLDQNKRTSRISTFFCVITLCLTLLAALKLGIYTVYFGLTLRRVLAIWALSILFGATLSKMIGLLSQKSIFFWVVHYALFSFVILTCINISSLVVG